ncbi:unnamed protein product [Mytilus coruscus]|uniref:Uncharacterized protein n=1 Tax=Mytilus coruscus TaxID=42192 RepID=A0A6J8C8H1_MYTCO|nr:unnamed protein product [Mytilus coruscus]
MTDSEAEETQLRDETSDASSLSGPMENTEQTSIGKIQNRFADLKRFKEDSPVCFGTVVALIMLLIISVCLNFHFSFKEKQSCIYDESCQNKTSPQMLKMQDDNNCSRKPTNDGSRNIGMVLKLELWEDGLTVVLRLPTNFILHKTSYDDEREIVLCRMERNHYYISCNKPYKDNCTIIHRREENTTIQEAVDRIVTYEISTKCIDQIAGLEWIQPQKYRSTKPKI